MNQVVSWLKISILESIIMKQKSFYLFFNWWIMERKWLKNRMVWSKIILMQKLNIHKIKIGFILAILGSSFTIYVIWFLWFKDLPRWYFTLEYTKIIVSKLNCLYNASLMFHLLWSFSLALLYFSAFCSKF